MSGGVAGILGPRAAEPRLDRGDRAGRHRAPGGRPAWPGQPARPRAAGAGPAAGRRHRRAAAERDRAAGAVPGRAAGRLVPHADQLAFHRAGDRLHRARQRGQGVLRARAVRRGRRGRRRRGGDPGRRPVQLRRRARVHPGARAARRPARPRCPTTAPPAPPCTTRRAPPAGRRACGGPLSGLDPDDGRRAAAPALLQFFGITARPAERAPGHLAELPHGGHRVRRQRPAHRPHAGLHGRLGRRAGAGAGRAVPGHQHPHGADPVQADAVAARGGPAAVRPVLDALADPRGRAVPGRDQAGDARLVGAVRLRVLRGHRGRRHDRHARRTGWPSRARSAGRGRSARS